MTSSEPSVPRSGRIGKADEESMPAVQTALGTEHAAIWTYRLCTAFLPDSADELDAGQNAHRAQRDVAERLVRGAGGTPVASEPAYSGGKQIDDQGSALALLVTAEDDTSTAWRGVLERTDDANLRRTALDALTSSAVRATRWRSQSGEVPASRPLPGAPQD